MAAALVAGAVSCGPADAGSDDVVPTPIIRAVFTGPPLLAAIDPPVSMPPAFSARAKIINAKVSGPNAFTRPVGLTVGPLPSPELPAYEPMPFDGDPLSPVYSVSMRVEGVMSRLDQLVEQSFELQRALLGFKLTMDLPENLKRRQVPEEPLVVLGDIPGKVSGETGDSGDSGD